MSKRERAKSFLKTRARGLERALFSYEFENGSVGDVLVELKAYQNEDGGFGHGLEPDFRCAASSALATTIGLQVLGRLPVDHENEMVQQVIGYLLTTLNRDKLLWEIVPPEVESAPRAPWWTYSANPEESWGWGNPSAEILGHLHRYAELVPPDLLATLTEKAVAYINSVEKENFHELLCFLRLEERLPQASQRQIESKIRRLLDACVTVDPEQWATYCLQPIQVAPSPQSRHYQQFADVLPANLDSLLEKQTQEGVWEPAWAWGQFEETWPQAKQDWCGWLTLENLRVLRAYSR
ncbi:hypothetical protein [Tumebacillus amylolyticus]|uniref:hypothetical protein n=1 Tax=Tumebacillus amylolyticus TaxID=2801339 RepID=UPI001F38BB30|nr:hypothetical protein [Tumebacillus amylolyticus]